MLVFWLLFRTLCYITCQVYVKEIWSVAKNVAQVLPWITCRLFFRFIWIDKTELDPRNEHEEEQKEQDPVPKQIKFV